MSASVPKKRSIPQEKVEEYMKARKHAERLSADISHAQQQYGKKLSMTVKELQRQFQSQHGAKMDELKDSEDRIEHLKEKGNQELNQKLQQLSLKDVDTKTVATFLQNEYLNTYYPDDAYERRKRHTAEKLKQLFAIANTPRRMSSLLSKSDLNVK